MPYESLFNLPSQDDKIWQNQDGRVWIKAEPDDPFGFLGCAMLGGFTQPGPASTPVWCPDPAQRRKFVQIDTIEAPPGKGSVSISMYLSKMNFLRQLQSRGCVYHLDARYGECGDPSAENSWEHILRFCGVRVGDLSSTDLHARDTSGEVDITAVTTFDQMYDIWKLAAENVAVTQQGNIIAVKFCDSASCGECGKHSSTGCNKVYAVAAYSAPYFGVSLDGGETWSWQLMTPTWTALSVPTDLACVGDQVVVLSTLGKMAYTSDAGLTWATTSVGFLVGCPGNSIFSLDARHTWIAADNGTIYFTADPTFGVAAQTNAALTASKLRDIFFVDSNNGYCVGDNNTYLYTTNGGNTWQAGVGPAAGSDLSTIWAYGDTLLVGTLTGTLWQSFDAGVTWTQRVLPNVTGTVNIQGIAGCGCSGLELFVLVDTGTYLVGTEGQLFRSIDGGITWREIDLPVNSGVRDVDCCSPNRAVVVGEALAGGTTAFIAVVSG